MLERCFDTQERALSRSHLSMSLMWLVAAFTALGCGAGPAPTGSRSGNPSSSNGQAASTLVGGAGATQGNGAQSTSPTLTTLPAAAGAPSQAGATQGGLQSQNGTANTIEPMSIDQCMGTNPAGLSPADTKRLMQGGGQPPRMLYPYNGTVFPRGMLPPTLMWEPAMPAPQMDAGAPPSADVVYVHMKSTNFEWWGCMKPTGPNQLELPDDVWKAGSIRTLGAGDPYTLELSTLTGDQISGPASLQLTIAQATIKGSIYYNSYVSSASFSGTIFRIPPGGKAEVFLSGAQCYGCHTVSANGERLIAHTGGDPGLSFALTPTTKPNPPQLSTAPLSGFAGLSPDGTVYVGGAHPSGTARPQGTPNEMALVNDAGLYMTDTGAAISDSGIPAGAMMPTFAPSGNMLVFNDNAVAQGRGLAVMDFDAAMRKASNHRVIFTDTDHYPGWPFFLPDEHAVVFARGTNPEFSGSGAGVIPGTEALAPESDLYIVDLKTGTSTILASAVGLNAPDDTTGYVPFGAEDLHKHFYPTVSPVPAGGYFWLFFDSIRHYGNLGLMRQLWGTAISIAPDGDYSKDRSHPAFYLPGQELGTGNHRAFAALNACMKDGDSCKSGVDCCGGFCFIPDNASHEFGDPVGMCTSQTPKCSAPDDRCTASGDCCPPGPGEAPASCVAGYCTVISLQ